ncbi:hypothetical protein HDE_11377 [Halotydeus destructor]|nr:hypothetical protein HDE_11377 [Halotydeus destructor]
MASLVKRRFDSLDLEDISCKIAVYDIGALKSFDGDGRVRRLFHEMTSYGTANLNCTEVVTSDVRSGEPDQYGNYSGVVGMVQSGEVDFAYMYMRLDCLNSDTLGVMAPIYAAGVRIVSPILDHGDSQDNVLPTSASDTFEPFLDTLTLVDGPSYCLICVAILTVAMVISFENGRMLPRRQLVTVFTGSLWNVFQLMVSQGKFRHKTVLLQSLWLVLTVGLFVIISGLFLNLLRTEKVAQRNPDQIETIDDINGTKFDRFEPKLIPNAFTYALRHQVKQGTKEGQIFKKVLKRKDNLVPLVSSNSNIIQFLYESMRTKDSYLLLEDLFWSPAKLMLCFVKPGNAIKVHTSRATVLDGILIVPFRPSVHLGFKLYVEHRLKNMFEMGLSGARVLWHFRGSGHCH